VTLVLLLLDIPLEARSSDYCKSEEELLPEREGRIVEMRSVGFTEDFAGCPKDWVKKMDEHLQEKYGGVKGYCQVIGFSEEEQEKLLGNLRA
jgi:protein-tyrosine phosphatase